MDIFRDIKRIIRKVHRFFNPLEKEFDKYMNDFHQKNKDKYGFDIQENMPLDRIGRRYKEWMNRDD